MSHSISQIQGHGSVIQETRSRREEWRRSVAAAAGQAENTRFSALIPLLPADYQPLLKALVDENNELLLRVRRRGAAKKII